jgi:photosystem II stability/assembly factor-like uncharacterized protein
MSETKTALIIANYRYEHSDLRQLVAPAQDAESLARVLADRDLGGFEVRTLINEPSYKLNLEIEDFCENRKRDDLLLIYFSGHGIKDADGQLYFATVDTQLVQHNVRRATAVSAQFVNQVMSRSRSRRQVLLLDCCYSGAFKHGMLAKGDKRVGAGEQLEGQGRVVLTASDALQYSFEGEHIEGEGVRSIFTRTLVQGLESGEADLDRDGFFSLDEVYEYVYNRVSDLQPEQKPTKMGIVEGRIFIGANPRPRAAKLPQELLESLESSLVSVRMDAVQQVGMLLDSSRKGLALAAQAALESLAVVDDSQKVRTAAAKCLESRAARAQEQAEAERKAREEAEEARRQDEAQEAREEAEARERAEAARKEREEEDARKKAEAQKAREEAEARERAEAGRKAREEEDARRKAEAQKAREEAVARERAEAERKAREEEESRRQAEAQQAQEEAEARERAEAERKAREKEESRRQAETQKAREEAEAREKVEAERQASLKAVLIPVHAPPTVDESVQIEGGSKQISAASEALRDSMIRAAALPTLCAAAAWGTSFVASLGIYRANVLKLNADSFGWMQEGPSLPVSLGVWFTLIAIGGGGASMAYWLTGRKIPLRRAGLWGGAWTISFVALILFIGHFRPTMIAGNAIELGVLGAVAGSFVGWVFQRQEPSLKRGYFLLTTACIWAVTWTLAWTVFVRSVASLNPDSRLGYYFLNNMSDVNRLSWSLASYVFGLHNGLYLSLFAWGAFVGASTGGIMFWWLPAARSYEQSQRVRAGAWLRRNRKWCLPLGISAAAAIAAGIVFAVRVASSDSDISRLAVSRAQSSAAVLQRLGEPIKRGWITSGSVIRGYKPSAQLSIPLSGPKGEGTLYVVAYGHYRGHYWTFQSLQFKLEGEATGVDLLRSELPVGNSAVSSGLLSGWAAGKGSVLLRTQDGRNWTSRPLEDQFYRFTFVTSQSGWATGEYGTILHTDDGGRTWVTQRRDYDYTKSLSSMAFATPQSGWAVGGSGTILHTDDGGQTWNVQNSGTTQDLRSVAFATPQAGSVVGTGTILHTEDGGQTWSWQSSGGTKFLESVVFVTSRLGWAVGDSGAILQTDDSGRTWKRQNSGTTNFLLSVTFVTPRSGWVVGDDGTILHTDDGGQTWKSQTSGTTQGLLSVAFTTPQSGWVVGGSDSSVILHTEDGGQSWTREISPTEAPLFSVVFAPLR